MLKIFPVYLFSTLIYTGYYGLIMKKSSFWLKFLAIGENEGCGSVAVTLIRGFGVMLISTRFCFAWISGSESVRNWLP